MEGELTLLGVIVIFLAMIILPTVHEVKEGYLGIYSRGGAIMSSVSEPGWHLKFPYITSLNQILIQIQTDKVTNIPCGTKNGVNLIFEKIEVVNQLKKELALQTIKNYTINYDKTWIFDKIHHEVNQFCSKHTLEEIYITKFSKLDEYLENALQTSCNQWAPGIKIINVRVTKPRVPVSTYQNYLQREVEKVTIFTEKARQEYITKKTEIEKMVNMADANTANAISKISMEFELKKKQIQQQIEELNDKIAYDKKGTENSAKKISQLKEINLQALQYSNKQYLINVVLNKIKDVNKVSYGLNIPDYIEKNSLIFEKVQKFVEAQKIKYEEIKQEDFFTNENASQHEIKKQPQKRPEQ